MSDLPIRGGDGQITSAIHLEFIRSVIDSNDATGVEGVEAFHRSLFLNQHGKELERCQQEKRTREERLASLESRLKQAESRLAGEDRLIAVVEDGVPDDRPTAPWNLWDRVMFGAAGAAVLCLLVFGIFNVSFNLLESGIITFAENPIRAYLWSALLPVGALAVKVGWDFLSDRRRRDFYLWTCLAGGVLAVLVWVAAYASVYPTLSRTTAEQIGKLDVFDEDAASGGLLGGLTANGVKRIDMILVGAQAMAEILLSATLGIYMTQLYARHRPVRLAVNPNFAQVDEDRRRLEERVGQERAALAEARGDEARLQHQLSVFVSYARSLFHRELAARKDRGQRKRLLIEETAEQLRSRLEAMDRGDEPAVASDGNGSTNGASRIPATRQEGVV